MKWIKIVRCTYKLFEWLFSRMLASHRGGPGSIPGRMEMTLVKSLHNTVPIFSLFLDPHFKTDHTTPLNRERGSPNQSGSTEEMSDPKQGVTMRCRLSWLTNSALARSQLTSTAVHRSPNKLWRSNSIFNLSV